jgi:hypothetical protein
MRARKTLDAKAKMARGSLNNQDVNIDLVVYFYLFINMVFILGELTSS